MFLRYIFSVAQVEAKIIDNSANINSSEALGGMDFLYPLLTGASVFMGGSGVVMLLITLFFYFVGAGDEDKMGKAHNMLFTASALIIISILLFFLAKMF